MILSRMGRIWLLCLLLVSGPSHAEGWFDAIARTASEWGKSVMERFRKDREHDGKRIQGKEILKPEEATHDDLPPADNPSEWDYIESPKQKCWFHKRTRKKVCEKNKLNAAGNRKNKMNNYIQ